MLKTTYTLIEAAELLSCHKETLRRAIVDGQLQAAKLGRGWRISRIDMEVFWTSKGGGELFSREGLLVVREEEEVIPEREKKKSAKEKKTMNAQLLLPTGKPSSKG